MRKRKRKIYIGKSRELALLLKNEKKKEKDNSSQREG